MTTTYEIPLSATPQTFSITLGTTQYRLGLAYLDTIEGSWILNISDTDGNSILAGVPLVTGHDLLEQYAYLGFAGALYVATDADLDAVPTFENLGTSSHLYFQVD
ncbi:hypothetical protein OSH11_11640 [Kaistia dalseonensis]|uniref:Cyanophage baseplate Pam3 plug gp18 domain-containing protein n=1 Tax=Kaistia dalseonensis TaxID=410840 RepID=A0ABU0H6K3_9HYPH|nr:hypothetical protein [Kaistia dalseonensis]MCX5495362.1 hypothetical protein [Kaistia dalseonensis]MDQ0437948.1 hypothetical protein [Kaistia dalseonensis]